MHNDSGRVTSWPNGWHGFLNEHSETTFVTARTHSLPDQRPLLAQAQLPAKLDEPRVKRLGWVAKMPEQRNRPGSWMLCARPRPMPSIHATPLLRIRLRPPTPMFFFEPSGSKDAQRFRLRSATHSERRVPRIGRLVLNEQEERDSPSHSYLACPSGQLYRPRRLAEARWTMAAPRRAQTDTWRNDRSFWIHPPHCRSCDPEGEATPRNRTIPVAASR